MSNPAKAVRLDDRIQVVRGLRVMIDADLAELYGVPTKALNQAVKRNIACFPCDFMFNSPPPKSPGWSQIVTTSSD